MSIHLRDISARAQAKALFGTYWAGPGEWPQFPVDSVEVARSLGVKVYILELSNELSGALAKGVGEDAVIFINGAYSYKKRRFTCAQEIGHYILRSRLEGSYQHVNKRNYRAGDELDAAEVFAERFAEELLMPEDACVQLTAQGKGITEIAALFDVSLGVVSRRLTNLGLVQPKTI